MVPVCGHGTGYRIRISENGENRPAFYDIAEDIKYYFNLPIQEVIGHVLCGGNGVWIIQHSQNVRMFAGVQYGRMIRPAVA